MAFLAVLILYLVERPPLELVLPVLGLYLIHLGEFAIEYLERRRSPTRPSPAVALYLLPGVVLLRRVVEFTVATLVVRLYLALLILLVLITLPLTLAFQGRSASCWIGRVYDRIELTMEPLLDALLRGYNAISLNPHPPGETGLVLAIPMPFREKIL